MKSSRKLSLIVGLPIVLAGCAYQPIEDVHDLSVVGVPQQWEQSNEAATVMARDPWLAQLGDRDLEAFVTDAVNNSYTLKAGMARMAQAEAVVRLQGGGKYPTLGLNFTTGTQENYSNLLGIVKTDINSLSLSSNWEIDIWGKVRNEQAAAFAQLQAAGYGYADLLLTMQSMVSKTWFSAVEAKLQLELAIQNRDSFVENLRTLEDRYLKGLVEAFDLRLFRAQSAANEAIVKQREVAYKTLVFQLQTLASLIPNGHLELSTQLPSLSDGVPVGIPSEVLLRRPDVRAAERQLAAKVGQRDATAKNWLPSFRITGSWGTSSNEIGELLDGDRLIWSLIGNLTAPLFQGGRLEAQRDLTEAQFQEQLQLYSQTILDALREVETALMREQLLADVEIVIAEAASEAKMAETQAWDLYTRGLRDITAVLDTQRRSVNAQGELLSIGNQRIQNRIDLHVALGGGFNPDENLAMETTTP